VTAAGTFEHGRSVLQRRADPGDPDRFERVRAALLAARGQRVRPGRDDKVVAAWNGLAISALAECGLLFARPDLIAAARDAAALLAGVHLAGGRLVRTSRNGVAGTTAGALDDYACAAEGFATLSGVTGEARWLDLAGQLLEVALGSFGDGQGGFGAPISFPGGSNKIIAADFNNDGKLDLALSGNNIQIRLGRRQALFSLVPHSSALAKVLAVLPSRSHEAVTHRARRRSTSLPVTAPRRRARITKWPAARLALPQAKSARCLAS